jgi:alpha,alpha-trehalase
MPEPHEESMIVRACSRRTPLAALLLALAVSSAGCQRAAPPAVAPAAGAAWYDPALDLGLLFHDVQVAALFPDSKTFADARPLQEPSEIARRYVADKGRPGFSLRAFVDKHFEAPQLAGKGVPIDTARCMEEHIQRLWPALTRPADPPSPYSSLIPLPNPYVVPGGRFREVYYWDSYFTMLGLIESGRTDLVRGMLDNFAYLIRTVGHIPNGNRTYYLGRSQPPYFGAMIGLYARAADSTAALRYLDALETEYAFWMDGASRLKPGTAYRRVVRLSDGAVLNRYYDDLPEPRPESYREDYTLAQTVPAAQRTALYRNLRASAESGWDFSSRWMRDPKDLRTLETTALVPVDLNSLLYHAEQTIAALRRRRGRAGDVEVAARFTDAAANRRRALLAAAYDSERGFFYDVRWRTGERVTDRPTLAAAAPLYFGLATPEQGRAVAALLGRDFLKPGGFVTTLVPTGQQWDAPNGWPPLEWLSIEGVRRYARGDLADLARERWLALNRRTYQTTGKMTEKYDVVDLTRRAGGGEYPTQDGFGWSNGVALTLAAQECVPGQGSRTTPSQLPHPGPVPCCDVPAAAGGR